MADEGVRCFMDGIDWQHEIGAALGGVTLFPSVDDCIQRRRCLRDGGGCGVVEVEVRLVRWVREQTLGSDCA